MYAPDTSPLEANADEPTWSAWLLEKLGPTVLVLTALYFLRVCWRAARANQKLSLTDAHDYNASERRGLLLPIRDPRQWH
jgi:hypothetical protein